MQRDKHHLLATHFFELNRKSLHYLLKKKKKIATPGNPLMIN